jgi:hypothetical protein
MTTVMAVVQSQDAAAGPPSPALAEPAGEFATVC